MRVFGLVHSTRLLSYLKEGIVFLLIFCGSSGHSQTPSPELKCAYKQGSDVKLVWQHQPDTCLPYYIYGSKDRNGPYNIIDSITVSTQKSYTHTGINPTCPNDAWYYYMTSSTGCSGSPIKASDTLDNCDPQPPSLQYVTVSDKKEVTIGWSVSSSPETYAYVIYWDKLGNNSFVELDTVFGRYNTVYTHDGSGTTQPPQPDNRPEEYTITSLDSCGNRGPLYSNSHKSIHLTDSIDPCGPSIHLDWTSYINWKAGVDSYQIYAKVNGGAFQQVGAVDTEKTAYIYRNINDGDSVCIYIKAKQNKGPHTARSNITCRNVTIVQPPAYTYISQVSVTPDSNIHLEWEVDPKADIESFSIQYRRKNGAYTDKKSFTKSAPADLTQPLFYNDQRNNPYRHTYYYRVISIDSCGSTYTSRNVSRNIYLTGELSANFVNHIQWQSYQEWINGVSHYNIYRKKETEWIKIDEVSDKKRSFKDNIKQLEDPDGKFCYRVEAVSNPDTFTAPPPKSVSNITCITQYPSIYIPNAFAPKGENKVFKPVLLYADKSDYTMRIYNRWGQLLFETHDPSTGWDGRVGGELMPQGAYMYVIQFTNTDGSSYRDQGSVILVR